MAVATAALIGTLAMAAAGAAAQGVTAGITSAKQAQAYRNAADLVKNATEQYSGENANKAITNAGLENARINNKQRMEAQANKVGNGPAAGNAYAGNQNIANASNTLGDYQSGASNQAKLNAGRYNQAANQAQLGLNQANIDYNVANQAVAGGLDTIAQGAKAYNQIAGTSDENEKDFTKADIQDSLRKIESIIYKYKNPEKPGEDDDIHVGQTAQDMEQTPLDENAVVDCPDGIKRIDGWELLESIRAAEGELQREIDELSKGNDPTLSNNNKEEE